MTKLNVKKVVSNKLNSLYVKSLMERKGWSKDYMKVLIVEFITTKEQVSFYEFMEKA